MVFAFIAKYISEVIRKATKAVFAKIDKIFFEPTEDLGSNKKLSRINDEWIACLRKKIKILEHYCNVIKNNCRSGLCTEKFPLSCSLGEDFA